MFDIYWDIEHKVWAMHHDYAVHVQEHQVPVSDPPTWATAIGKKHSIFFSFLLQNFLFIEEKPPQEIIDWEKEKFPNHLTFDYTEFFNLLE